MNSSRIMTYFTLLTLKKPKLNKISNWEIIEEYIKLGIILNYLIKPNISKLKIKEVKYSLIMNFDF